MKPPTPVAAGRLFFGVSMVAFGVLFFIFSGSIGELAPAWPAWMPGQPWGYLAGAFLSAGGLSIILGRGARTAALLLGSTILLWDLLRDVDLIKLAATSLDIVKALALGGGAFVVAGTLPKESRGGGGFLAAVLRPLERLIPLGRFFLAPQMIVAGAEHFIYAKYVFEMVPSWIPGHPFWTYFTGAALIAGGIGLAIQRTARMAATLLGSIIFVWVLVLHLPRAFSMQSANEWTSVFQALAMSGTAFILGATPDPEGTAQPGTVPSPDSA